MPDHRGRENPFAAPAPIVDDSVDEQALVEDGAGPPWEQPGPWAKRFFETLWFSYRHPFLLFRGMRRRGSWWMPVAYCLLAHSLTLAVSTLFQLNSASAEGLVSTQLQEAGVDLLDLPINLVFAAMLHLLLVLAGTRQPLVATFRAVFYASGSATLVGIAGDSAWWLMVIVFPLMQIIAIKETHRMSGVRATFVVLLAFGVVSAVVIAIYVTGMLAGVFPEPA